MTIKPVIPAKAGIHDLTIHLHLAEDKSWMPAYAGMTLEIIESHFKSHLVLYQLTWGLTLCSSTVIPAQAGIHDFSATKCWLIVKSWMPAFAGMTEFMGQTP